MRTGYIEKHYIDDNPLSSSYMQERVETVQDDVCFNWQPDMVAIETTDEYVVYQDMNQNSYTFGFKVTVEVGDTNPAYVEAYSMCEQIMYNDTVLGNNGSIIVYQVDCNPDSSTYKELSSYTEVSEECALPDMSPQITTSSSCMLKTYLPSGVSGTYGKSIVKGVDVNPYSATYNQTIFEREMDDEECLLPDVKPHWHQTCTYCMIDNDGNLTGWRKVILEDINAFSATYGSEISREEFDNKCLNND